MKDALRGAEYSAGDKVICAEWFSNDPLPEPKWYRDRLSSTLDAIGSDNLNRSIERIAAGRHRDSALAAVPHIAPHRVAELSDHDLLHAAMGVTT